VQVPSRTANAREPNGKSIYRQPHILIRRIGHKFPAELMPSGRDDQMDTKIAPRRERTIAQASGVAADTGMSNREYLER
jgi:hypothetical protein